MARYKGKRENHDGQTQPHAPSGSPAEGDLPAAQPVNTEAPVTEEESAETGKAGETEAPDKAQAPAKRETPAEDAAAVKTVAPPLGDPFADDVETTPLEEGRAQSGLYDRFMDFAATRTGKIVLFTVVILVALAVAVAIFLYQWVRSPDIPLPNSGNTGAQVQDQPPVNHGPVNPPDDGSQTQGPTDDELYPDDGFTGDIPTVSGERKDGVYTFLLVGTDLDDGNTDTLMVASYDTNHQALSVMSIPRDTMVNASWDIKKINSIYARYGAGDNGMSHLMDQIARLIGFRPDFYVKVDLEMFVELVDLVDGVEFEVPQDMNYDDPYQDLHIHLSQGLQVLDGEKAMQLVRFRRYPMGDIERVQVQQDFLKALIKTCLSLEHWGKIKSYIELALDHVQLSEGLDYGNIVWFAAQALGLGQSSALSIDSVYTCTLPGNYTTETWSRDTGMMQSYVTIYPNEVVRLVNARFNPYEEEVTTDMLDAMSILSNGDIASSTGSLRDSRHNGIMAVRRGEAYYDEEGNLVYGTKPDEPDEPTEPDDDGSTPPAATGVMQDGDGNYFIVDENGNIIDTDENGTPLSELEGPGEDGGEAAQPVENETGEDVETGGEAAEPGEDGESGQVDEGKENVQPGEDSGGEAGGSEGDSDGEAGEEPPEENGGADTQGEDEGEPILAGLLGLLGL